MDNVSSNKKLNVSSNKKAKGTKKCVIKRIIKFYDYKDYLLKIKSYWSYSKRLKVKCLMHIF